MSSSMSDSVYQKTRQAWRDIWIGTEFDKELRSLEYKRSQEILNVYLPFLSTQKTTLEAGCGPAHVVHYLQQKGFPTIGLDYAPEALSFTHQNFPELRLHLGDVHSLPYPENTFGAYLSFGVLEHFEHGPSLALSEAYRVLAPNGILVLTIPHPQITESIYQFWRSFKRVKQQRSAYYERTYSHNELAHFVTDVGFTIERLQPVGHSYTWYGLHSIFRKQDGYYETSRFAELIGALSRRLMPWSTAFHTLVIARKPHG